MFTSKSCDLVLILQLEKNDKALHVGGVSDFHSCPLPLQNSNHVFFYLNSQRLVEKAPFGKGLGVEQNMGSVWRKKPISTNGVEPRVAQGVCCNGVNQGINLDQMDQIRGFITRALSVVGILIKAR